MKIEELSKEYGIAPAVYDIVALVSESTGKEVDFELILNMSTDGSTRIARERMPRHIIQIKENSTARVNHIIAHECGHILRTMAAAPTERVVPSSNPKTLTRAFDDLKDELAAVPAQARDDLFNLWVSGTINQLVNLPVDVRIESWLYENYPEFRDTQKKSIEVDVKNCLSGLSSQVMDITIKSVFKRSNAMVYAYLKGISGITGKDYGTEYESYRDIIELGETLYACFEPEDKGFKQDIATIDRWAEILNIKDWFTWIGFEDVPESYYE